MDVIDTQKLFSLRPASVRPRLAPRDETLPLAPATLLPALHAPLLEIPGVWGGWMQPCLRGASAADAPMCVSLDAEGGVEKPGPRGLHQGVGEVLLHARRANFRRPLVIHARLGLVDPEDEASVDLARLRVMEAVDAGATSVQLGAFGDPAQAARSLAELLLPASQYGAGVVVQLMDSAQALVVPAELARAFAVDAWVATSSITLEPRREALASPPQAPFAAWVDGTALLGGVIRQALSGAADLQNSGALLALWEQKEDPRRDRLEMRLCEETEALLNTLRARGSAGHAMVALSRDEVPVPFGDG
jgi:hypothetical protein